MKKLIPTAALGLAVALLASTAVMQAAEKKKGGGGGAAKKQGTQQRVSPHESVYARVAGQGRNASLVSITYGRPYSAKGGKGEPRNIWGELVKWDQPYRLGADEATLILLQHPIEVQGKTIPKGAHTLYMVPSESGASKLVFSSNIGKWGVPVDTTHDIARVDLEKSTLNQPVDQLTIRVENAPPDGGVIKIMWENTQFALPFKVKK